MLFYRRNVYAAKPIPKPDGGRAGTQTDGPHRPAHRFIHDPAGRLQRSGQRLPGPHGNRRRNRPDRLEPGFPGAVVYGGGVHRHRRGHQRPAGPSVGPGRQGPCRCRRGQCAVFGAGHLGGVYVVLCGGGGALRQLPKRGRQHQRRGAKRGYRLPAHLLRHPLRHRVLLGVRENTAGYRAVSLVYRGADQRCLGEHYAGPVFDLRLVRPAADGRAGCRCGHGRGATGLDGAGACVPPEAERGTRQQPALLETALGRYPLYLCHRPACHYFASAAHRYDLLPQPDFGRHARCGAECRDSLRAVL